MPSPNTTIIPTVTSNGRVPARSATSDHTYMLMMHAGPVPRDAVGRMAYIVDDRTVSIHPVGIGPSGSTQERVAVGVIAQVSPAENAVTVAVGANVLDMIATSSASARMFWTDIALDMGARVFTEPRPVPTYTPPKPQHRPTCWERLLMEDD